MGHGERHRAQPVASGDRPRKPASPRARRCRDGRTGTRPPTAPAASTASPRSPAPSSTHRISAPPICRAGRRRPRTRMLVRAPDATHVYTGIDLARLSGALKPSVVVTAADLAQDRHPRSRILCRRPVLPGRQDAALSRPAGGAADLREVRRLRSGAARAARRDLREVRRGDRPGRRCRTTAPIASRASPAPTPDAPDVYSPVQAGWVSPGRFENTRLPDLGAARRGPTAAPIRQGRDLRRADPRRACGEQSGPAGARPRVRDPIRRPDVPRAGMRPRLVRRRRARASSSCSACSRPTRRRSRSRILLGEASAPFKPARINAQFAYLGGGFGGRDHTPFPLYVALAAMFFPGRPVRLAHDRYQQFQARHQAARLQDAHRGSASIARPARSRPSPPITCWMAAASPIFRPASRPSAPPARSASTTFRRSTSPRSRCIRAA